MTVVAVCDFLKVLYSLTYKHTKLNLMSIYIVHFVTFCVIVNSQSICKFGFKNTLKCEDIMRTGTVLAELYLYI